MGKGSLAELGAMDLSKNGELWIFLKIGEPWIFSEIWAAMDPSKDCARMHLLKVWVWMDLSKIHGAMNLFSIG